MDFKLWLEAKIERDLAQQMVLDAANVSGDNALSQSVSAHKEGLATLAARGVLKPFSQEIQQFINQATDTTTLNDLINHIVQVSSGDVSINPNILPGSPGPSNNAPFGVGQWPSTG